MIQINSAPYYTYEAPNLQNVEFFYSNGDIVPSWLESGNSTATSTIYWLNIAEGISAGSSITVYMGFASTSTSLLNSQTTGEAPQLSPSYGQYDNGKMIFSFYDNFAGSRLGSGWVANMTSGSYSVNNGLSLSYVKLGEDDLVGSLLTSSSYSAGEVFDAFITDSMSGGIDMVGFYNVTIPMYPVPGAGITEACNGVFPDQYSSKGEANACGGRYGLLYQGKAEAGVYTVALLSASSSIQYFNYGVGMSSQPVSTDAPTYPLPAGFAGWNTNPPETVQWARVRALPPDGMMPAFAIGTLTVPAPTTTSVECSPSSLVRASSTTCTATVMGHTPTGVVSFTSTGSGTFTPTNGQCTLTGGSCSLTYSQNTVGSPMINASYGGDPNNFKSSGSIKVTFIRATTTTGVVCTPSTPAVGESIKCAATVTGASPTGNVVLSQTGGTGSFTPLSGTCTLFGGSCNVTYTQSVPGSITITGTYNGDPNNFGSSGSFQVAFKTSSTTTITCTGPVAAGGVLSCKAAVTGFSPTGTVSFAQTGGSGSFTPTSCALSSGSCSVAYTQGSVGTLTVTGSYSGDANNEVSSGSTAITFNQASYTLYYLAAVVILAVVVVVFVLVRRRTRSIGT